jgi:hypothetical protein
MATIIGLFHDLNEVQQTQQALAAAGFDVGRSSVVTRDPNIEAQGGLDILLTIIADSDDAIGNARLIMRRNGAEDIEQRDDDNVVAADNDADRAYNLTSGGDATTGQPQ